MYTVQFVFLACVKEATFKIYGFQAIVLFLILNFSGESKSSQTNISLPKDFDLESLLGNKILIR